ncbi:MAG: hypothetical protein K9I85_11640 [Saprospiraceae bacterium]|nr:hypothetical protein [Saprospiraceae bacterium]
MFETVKKRDILLGAQLTSVFVAAFALTTYLHEGTHALIAKWAGVHPVLFHSYVSYSEVGVPPMDQLWIAAAGPIWSLFQGLFFLWIGWRFGKKDLTHLFWIWLGIMGMVVFLGYIMMGPFMEYGDTGKIYAILATPQIVTIGLAIIGLVGIVFIFRRITPQLSQIIERFRTEVSSPVFQLFILPIILGTGLNVLLSLPAPTPMSLMLPFVIFLTLIPSMFRMKEFLGPSASDEAKITIPVDQKYWPIVLMVLLLILSRVLAAGISV